MEIHNGQGLGIYDGGKLTAIISDGGGSQVGMVGSEWLTSISILQFILKKAKKTLTHIVKISYCIVYEK
tara:strand:+ start:298 stop:504 length:207 start_codon:yes stop_codon:yes gene_type:complete